MASFNISSFFGLHQCFLTASVIWCIILCLPMMTNALPMKDVVGQAMMMAKMDQQQQHHPHREKRAVTETSCAQPDNLQAIFQQINSGMNRTQFLQKAINGQAISIPASESARLIDGDPNETKSCPSSIPTDSSAPLAHRSLCPYYFDILQLPEGYYPPTLHWAKCKCQHCLGNNAYGCEAVQTPITVLKPVSCFQGLQKYQEEVIQVNTACACAFTGNMQTATTTTAATTTTTASWGVE